MIREFTATMGSSKGLLRMVLLTVAALLTAFLVYGIWRAMEREQGRSTAQGSLMEAAMQLSHMDYTEMENGRRIWTLKSETASYYQQAQKSVLKNVRMVFYLKDGRQLRLTSTNGVLYIDTKNLELWGGVSVEMPEGYTIRTEKVDYRHRQHLVTAETPTTLEGPELTLKGERWEYRIDQQHGTLEGTVQAVMDLSKLKHNAGS